MAKAEKARLDTDKKAKPRTRLIRQVNPAHAINPSQGASAIEHEDGSRTALRVPRNDRPARKDALRALERYLAKHPDLRIGQALWAIASRDPFYLEDEDLIERVYASL